MSAGAEVRGLLVVYTGHGKGKTTAALGMVFRALGRGMRVTVVQFIKGKWKTGERLFAERLCAGFGAPPPPHPPPEGGGGGGGL